MADLFTRIFTKNISSETYTISETYGFTVISVMLISGSGSISGSLSNGGDASDALVLQIGIPVTVTSNSNYPLDGIVIISDSASIVQFMAK